jgi:hypothetical protein
MALSISQQDQRKIQPREELKISLKFPKHKQVQVTISSLTKRSWKKKPSLRRSNLSHLVGGEPWKIETSLKRGRNDQANTSPRDAKITRGWAKLGESKKFLIASSLRLEWKEKSNKKIWRRQVEIPIPDSKTYWVI